MKPLYIPKGRAKEYGDYAVNIPEMDAIIKGAIRERFNPCDHCHGIGPCRDCIITEWREGTENE